MGHPTDIFLKKPDDSIICSICLEVLDDPASFKECGHTFCAKCISACLSSANTTCPTCRQSIETGSNPTYILRDLIGKLDVKCPNSLLGSDSDNNSDNGSNNPPSKRLRAKRLKPTVDESDGRNNETACCDWKGTISELDQHLADECPFTTIECGEEGCKHTCQRRHLAAHKSSQQGIIAHMKLKHQNELTAIKLEYEDKLAAMKKKYEQKCKRMNRKIAELEETISVEAGGWCAEDPSSDEESDFSGRGKDVVRGIKVEGAGLQEVNGTYRRCGQHDGVQKFIKRTRYNGQLVNFMLFRCILTDSTRRWYISIVPEDALSPGTTQDIDFYEVSPAAHQWEASADYNIPPRDGWIATANGQGVDPAPTVARCITM
jgi:hypothetical protein